MVNMILTGIYLFTAKICLVNPFAWVLLFHQPVCIILINDGAVSSRQSLKFLGLNSSPVKWE